MKYLKSNIPNITTKEEVVSLLNSNSRVVGKMFGSYFDTVSIGTYYRLANKLGVSIFDLFEVIER